MKKMSLENILVGKTTFVLLGIFYYFIGSSIANFDEYVDGVTVLPFTLMTSTEDSSTDTSSILKPYTVSQPAFAPYDITLVCKLNKNCTDTCSDYSSISYNNYTRYCKNVEIHSRTNSIGLPVYFNGRVLNSGKKSLEFIVDKFYSNSMYSKNLNVYSLSYSIREDAKGNSLQLELINDKSFKIHWIQNETVEGCISITYLKKKEYYNKHYNNYYNNYYGDPISIVKIFRDDELLIDFTLENTDDLFKTSILRFEGLLEKNNKYNLTILNSNFRTADFKIKRIAQCTDFNNLDMYEIRSTEIIDPMIYVYPNITKEEAMNDNSIEAKECGVNKYGADCSAMCSHKKTFCQNMLFCTSSGGCTCASGYGGPLCSECPAGFYGHNCQKTCSENCKNQCNAFTGFCNGGCEDNYILPYCVEKYPVLIEPPQLKHADFYSINLVLNLKNESMVGMESKSPNYYQIVYKPTFSDKDFKYSEIRKIVTEDPLATIHISNLNSGTMYTFGTILITEDGNFNKDDINTANYATLCSLPEKINYEMELAPGIDSISVTWKNLKKSDTNDCNITSFIVKLTTNLTLNENSMYYEEITTEDKTYVFVDLIPAHRYAVQITGQTILGSTNISDVKYASTKTSGYIGIEDISVSPDQSSDTSLYLTWKLNDLINIPISYKIKYKVKRHYSCSNTILENEWTEIIVNNTTEYSISDLTPNSQYIIKIEPITSGYEYYENENTIYAMTTCSTPQIAPDLDHQSLYINNQTALIKWKVDRTQCVKINGFQIGFHYKLKDLEQGIIIENDTEDTSKEFNNLIPNASYVLEVYIKTNEGYNKNYALKVPFKTKSKFLPAVENLSVYKKNTKTKSIGLRWSYSDNSDVVGFIIILSSSNNKSNSKKMTIEHPSKCTAWQDMFCETIENLTPSTQYTIKVKAKSLDYPNGGLVSSEDFNTIDGIPDEPGNLTATYVGTNNITLEWSIPWMFNGALNSFIINAEEVSAVDIDSCCTSLQPIELVVTEEKPTYTYTLNDLKPGSTYTIGVLSKTSWYGQAKRTHVTTLMA